MTRENYNVAFFGTSDFSVVVLEELEKTGFTPTKIITAPDAPQGRKLVLTASLVKLWARTRNIPVLEPKDLNDHNFLAELKETPWDLFIVASYGKIIPEHIINLPRKKTLNVHPSLLPKFRGASPIQTTILQDERETGVTIMELDEKMDHGPIVSQKEVELRAWPLGALDLEKILAHEGGRLLAETIPLWVRGQITPQPQNHAEATFTNKIKKVDGLLKLDEDPYKNYLKILAYQGWPHAYFFTERNGKEIRVNIMEASFKDDVLTIERVIPEGKREMEYKKPV